MLGAWLTCGYRPDMIEPVGRGVVLFCVLATACAATAPPPKTATAAAPGAAVAKAPAGPTVIPPVTLLPAATARPYQMATISIGSFDRLLANGVKLVGSAVPIPMTADGLRDMLLSEAGLPPELAANLDLASPSGAAVVALDDKGKSGVVLAIPARGPAEAEKLIAALGKPVMTSGPLTMLANPAGKSQGWVYRAGAVVVIGDEVDAMARGTMLALEARHPSADDATTTIYPQAIARAHGTDVKSAIAAFLDEMRQMQTAQSPLMTPDNYVYETFGTMLGLVGDAERIEIGLSLDPARGLILRSRLMARPGTMLEATAREVRPFEIDRTVLGGTGAPVMIGAMSIGTLWKQILGHYRERLAADKGKGAAAALAYYDAFLAGMAGGQSGMMALSKEAPYFTGAFSTPLKDAATATKVGGALGRMDNAATSALLRAQLGSSAAMLDWTSKRESVGKAKAIHFRMTIKKGSAFDSDAVRKWIGSGFDLYQAAAGTRVVITFGRDARARLAAIASGKAAAPAKSASFTEAETGAKGRDGFYYFDLAPVLGLVGTLGASPRLAAVAHGGSGPIPLVFTAGGDGVGKSWTMDLTLPLSAFTSIGALVTSGAMSSR
jgi:hypothetical protein